MSDKIELEPCPFCGAKAEMGLNFGRLGIACTVCQANMRSKEVCGDYENESLIAIWNQRSLIMPCCKDSTLNATKGEGKIMQIEATLLGYGYDPELGTIRLAVSSEDALALVKNSAVRTGKVYGKATITFHGCKDSTERVIKP